MVDYGSDMMDLLAWNLATGLAQPPAADLIGYLLRDGSALRAKGLLRDTKERPAPAIVTPFQTGVFE